MSVIDLPDMVTAMVASAVESAATKSVIRSWEMAADWLEQHPNEDAVAFLRRAANRLRGGDR